MAANPERGEVDLDVGGASYVLAMSFNGLIELQKLFATNGVRPKVEDILGRVRDGDFEAFRAVFWAMFRRHHPDVTIEQAGDLMDRLGGLDKLDTLLSRAMDAGAPDPRDVAAMEAVSGPRPPRPAAMRRRGGTGGK